MSRILRCGLPATLACLLTLGPIPRSFAGPATQSLAYTFVLPCDSSVTQVSTVSLPSGVYRATITGACTLDGNWYTVSAPHPVPSTTPCAVGGEGIPCVGLPNQVQQVPGEVCWTETGGNAARPCDDAYPAVTTNSCPSVGRVYIDNVCRVGDTFTFSRPTAGPVTAQLYDSYYFDNNGVTVVTITWTP